MDFRRRLAEKDPSGELLRKVFDQVAETAIAKLGLSTSEQRVDSTLVRSNVAKRSRQALLRDAVAQLLKEIEKQQHSSTISEEIIAWFATKQEWTKEIPTWLAEVLQVFADNQSIADTEVYQHSATIFAQQVERVPPSPRNKNDDNHDESDASKDKTVGKPPQSRPMREEDAVSYRVQTKFQSDSITSVHDTDCRYGHKGNGYFVHATETCRNEGREILTDIAVVPANRLDKTELVSLVTRLIAAERAPQTLYADGGYAGAEAVYAVHQKQLDTVIPVHRSGMGAEKMSREDFAFDDEGHVTECPQGHTPNRHAVIKACSAVQPVLHAYFRGEHCGSCDKRSQCPATQLGRKSYDQSTRLNVSPALRLRDKIFVAQQTDEWKKSYRIRAGVEATISELKRGHAMRQLTVRKLVRVTAIIFFKAIACNIKRWTRSASQSRAPSFLPLFPFLRPPIVDFSASCHCCP